MSNLAIDFDDAFDDPTVLLIEERQQQPTGHRAATTDATRARYEVLKTKKLGETWEESGRRYRMGPSGVTVFKPECFG